MSDFVHLHLHTEYSLLDGAIRINRLAARLKELRMDSVAVTDHGSMYGAVEFYKALKAEGIKPIIGCEVYFTTGSRFEKEGKSDNSQGHLVLLAKNSTGYKNLTKLVSIGFTEGFYYKPRIDLEVLEKHAKGLICLSGCLGGEVPSRIMMGDYDGARKMALKFLEIFGEGNFYLELQDHGIEEQRVVNAKLIQLSKETGIPLVATNDAHYLEKEDAKAHEVLLCIQTGKTIIDQDRMTFESEEFYLKSYAEMKQLFQHVPEAIENTVKIAEKCNFEFEFGNLHLPKFQVPEGYTPEEYLKYLCFEGLKWRYGDDPSEEKIERLEYELSVIKQMGYVDYFLIVQDFIRFARKNKIMVGPGRGSAAGSIVAYCLGITNLDPLKYNLLFERFLNPERISMPDIDIDFCYERRQEVIDYVVAKYGEDRVAQIITFGTLAARAAIKDTGRALAIPYAEVDQIAKLIPAQIGITIEKALELSSELRERYESDESVKNLIDMALKLEGMPRHSSTHAAGVVITANPVTDYVPVSRQETGITTQFTMNLLEELGLLKMDFLGLRTLTVIRDACRMIKKNHNKDIDIENIDMSDEKVYNFIGEGKTAGIFQLESTGMTQFFKELQPTCLEDIIAGVALYRPGPMDSIPTYLKNKRNQELVKYNHPKLEKILEVTYGCMVYQEQVMHIVRELAGYSMGRADLVRRAMSKKIASVMEQERKNFVYGIVSDDGTVEVDGCLRRGISETIANKIFDEMMAFASYAFNKSHAAAYSVISYQTAWLKYYFPTEFMAALLNSFLSSPGKISQYVSDAKNMGIEVLPPDINESGVGFTVVNGKIRFGLAAIKNVGETVVSHIIEERKQNGRFTNFRNFCERVDDKHVGKKCVESMIKCGTFDSMGKKRSQLMTVFEKLMDSIASTRKRNLEGQFSLFDMMGEETGNTNIADTEYPDIKEYPKKLLLSMEKDMLGVFVSGHPLMEFRSIILSSKFTSSSKLGEMLEEERQLGATAGEFTDGKQIRVAGIVTSRKNKVTKNNNLMAFVTIEDLYGPIEILVFPAVLDRCNSLVNEESIIQIEGHLSVRDDDVKVIAEKVQALTKRFEKKLYIRFPKSFTKDDIDSVKEYLKKNQGPIPVLTLTEGETRVRPIHKDYWVDLNDEILEYLKKRVGVMNVGVK